MDVIVLEVFRGWHLPEGHYVQDQEWSDHDSI